MFGESETLEDGLGDLVGFGWSGIDALFPEAG